MLKKYTWIVAAFVTLAMVFSFTITGCNDGRDIKYGELSLTPKFQMSTDATIQAMADGTRLTNSSSPWLRRGGANGHITFEKFGTVGIHIVNDQPDASNTVEIRTNTLNTFFKDGYAQGRAHMVAVSGTVLSNYQIFDGTDWVDRQVSFAGAGTPVPVASDGSFMLARVFSWDALTDKNNGTIRLNLGGMSDGEALIVFIDEIIVGATHACGCYCGNCINLIDCDGDFCAFGCQCTCCIPPFSSKVIVVQRNTGNWVGVDLVGAELDFQLNDIIEITVIGVTQTHANSDMIFSTFAGNTNAWGTAMGQSGSLTWTRNGVAQLPTRNPSINAEDVLVVTITLDAADMALLGVENRIRIFQNNWNTGDSFAIQQITLTRGGNVEFDFASRIASAVNGPLTSGTFGTLLGPEMQGAGGIGSDVQLTVAGP